MLVRSRDAMLRAVSAEHGVEAPRGRLAGGELAEIVHGAAGAPVAATHRLT